MTEIAIALALAGGAYALGRRAGRRRGYAEGRVAGTVATLKHWADAGSVASDLPVRTSAPPSRPAGGADA